MSMCRPAFDGETGGSHRGLLPRSAEVGDPPASADGDREAVYPPDPEALLVEYLLVRLAALE
jgi:hypothetical protein